MAIGFYIDIDFGIALNCHIGEINQQSPFDPAKPILMPFSLIPDPSGTVHGDNHDEPQKHPHLNRPLSAVALARRDALSDIPESASDKSSDDVTRLSLDSSSAGAILQLVS